MSLQEINCKWEELEPWEKLTWERSSKVMHNVRKEQKNPKYLHSNMQGRRRNKREVDQAVPSGKDKKQAEDTKQAKDKTDKAGGKGKEKGQKRNAPGGGKRQANVRLPPTL
mmetsp:Transcript_19208/g.33960  ORF Transcript_19208/g.33960 Transcript_19208/m.33960 type:complete len:111 (-) Transcript_19208:206-538(-)